MFFSKNSRKFATSPPPAKYYQPIGETVHTLVLRWELWRSLTASEREPAVNCEKNTFFSKHPVSLGKKSEIRLISYHETKRIIIMIIKKITNGVHVKMCKCVHLKKKTQFTLKFSVFLYYYICRLYFSISHIINLLQNVILLSYCNTNKHYYSCFLTCWKNIKTKEKKRKKMTLIPLISWKGIFNLQLGHLYNWTLPHSLGQSSTWYLRPPPLTYEPHL